MNPQNSAAITVSKQRHVDNFIDENAQSPPVITVHDSDSEPEPDFPNYSPPPPSMSPPDTAERDWFLGAIGRSATPSPIHYRSPTPPPVDQLALEQEHPDDAEFHNLLWQPLMLVSDFEIDTQEEDWNLPSRFGPIRAPTPPLTRGQDEDNPIYISSTDSSDTDED